MVMKKLIKNTLTWVEGAGDRLKVGKVVKFEDRTHIHLQVLKFSHSDYNF